MGYLSPPPAPAPVVVYKDVGGLVTDYEAQTEQYRRENREVRLHECRSACTLALSLPNVCVYPDAKIKFHQAYNALTREVDLGISAKLFAAYPAAVQTRLGYLTREYRILSGTELIALGMRNCTDKNPVLIAGTTPKTPPATIIANARPDVNPNPWGDIAHKVQSAVTAALSGGTDRPQTPIRIAVANRQDVARTSSEPDSPVTGRSPAAVDAPLPPKRPRILAFTPQEAETPPARRLINGAEPILGDTQFTQTALAR